MKPMGKEKTLIENNHQDWRVKGKLYKKYKHGERQKAKKQIKKQLNYDVINDFEKEYQIRMEREEND